MAYELRRQPTKGLYVLYQILTTAFLRFPLWFLLALPRSRRPCRSWTLMRCLSVAITRHVLRVQSKIGRPKVPTYRALVKGPGIKGVWVDPAPELVRGALAQWASAARVESVRVAGYWYDEPGSDISPGTRPFPGEKVLYALHGGGYIAGSANPNDLTANVAQGIVEHCKPIQRAFSLEYRLSKAAPYKPENPFPAALLDAIAGYKYLVHEVGFDPKDVILEGDSAGGHLALALARYLVENRTLIEQPITSSPSETPNIPGPPGLLLLLSPLCDTSASYARTPESSAYTCAHSDYTGDNVRSFAQTGEPDYETLALLGTHPRAWLDTHRYFSPASLRITQADGSEAPRLFDGFPPTFVVAGGAETMRDSIRTLQARMGATYLEPPDAIHDYLCFTRHEPERTDTLKAIAQWVDKQSSVV